MKKNSPAETQTTSGTGKGKLRENIEALVIAVILALFIRAFVVQAFKIPSGSMKNTLLVGDYILVNKFIYGVKIPFTDFTIIPIKDPQRGDIIVFKYPKDPSKDYIKRVVGIGGDKVEIRDKKVYVNGELQKSEFALFVDPHILPDGLECRDDPISGMRSVGCRDNMDQFTVPENELFVMGDNRDSSNDSRYWGFVDKSAVRGKALLIYWSWDKQKRFGLRWNRLGHLIH